jgi:hypothetical protein
MKNLKYPTIMLFFFYLIAFVPKVHAYDVTLSLGNLCEYVDKIQVDENGGKNFCEFNPYLASSIDFTLGQNVLISPEIGLSFPKKGRDENISKMTFFGLAHAKYKFTYVHLSAGAGLFFTRISANGGEEDLNNGNSSSSFPLPEGAVYSRNFIVNLGMGADFNKDWSADLHTYIFNIIKSEDRALSIAINGTYHFGEF